MRVGVSLTTAFDHVAPDVSMRWIAERAQLAYQAGASTLTVGDHHALGTAYHQNIPTLARLASEWPQREFGAMFVLPLWHPVLLAEQLGTVAAMFGGPMVVLAGLGYGEREFAAMGVRLADRVARFERSLAILRDLLTGNSADVDEPWEIRAARVRPIPATPPEFWIAAGAARAIDRAARLGDAWVAGPGVTVDQARQQMAVYRDALDRNGRQVPARVVIRRDVHIGATRPEALAATRAVREHGYRGLDPETPVVGSPHDVADVVSELTAIGFTDVLVRQIAPEQPAALASIGRLPEVVGLVNGGPVHAEPVTPGDTAITLSSATRHRATGEAAQ